MFSHFKKDKVKLGKIQESSLQQLVAALMHSEMCSPSVGYVLIGWEIIQLSQTGVAIHQPVESYWQDIKKQCCLDLTLALTKGI